MVLQTNKSGFRLRLYLRLPSCHPGCHLKLPSIMPSILIDHFIVAAGRPCDQGKPHQGRRCVSSQLLLRFQICRTYSPIHVKSAEGDRCRWCSAMWQFDREIAYDCDLFGIAMLRPGAAVRVALTRGGAVAFVTMACCDAVIRRLRHWINENSVGPRKSKKTSCRNWNIYCLHWKLITFWRWCYDSFLCTCGMVFTGFSTNIVALIEKAALTRV